MQYENNEFEMGRGRRGHGGRRGMGRGPMGMSGMGGGPRGPRGPRGGMPGMPGFPAEGGWSMTQETGDRRRGPGRGRKGDVRNAVLALLAEEPRNGYQLIGAIAEKSQGLWRPGAGSVYPALQMLEDEGLIEAVDADGKKRFELTEDGREYLADHADETNAPWERVAEPHKGFLDIRAEIGQLAMAVNQVAHAGTPDQIQRARDVLDRARKDLYKILAED